MEDLNEHVIKSIMDKDKCTREEAVKKLNAAIIAGAELSDEEMAEFDDCLPTDEEWAEILSGIDNSDLE